MLGEDTEASEEDISCTDKKLADIPHDANITLKSVSVTKQRCQGLKPDKHYGLHSSEFSAKTAVVDQDMLAQVCHPPLAVCTIQQWEEVERTGMLQVMILSTMEFMVAGMRHHLAAARISQEAHQKAVAEGITRAAATVAGRSHSRGERNTPVASFPEVVVVVAAAARASPRILPLTRDPPRRGSSQWYLRPSVPMKHLPKDKYLIKKTYLPKTLLTSHQPSPCPQVTPLVHIPLPQPDVPVGGRLFQFIDHWEKVCDDSHILEVVRSGVSLS